MATGSNDSAIVYSILKFLQGKINSESIADEKKESLEVSLMCLQEVFEVNLDSADHQAQFGSNLSLEELFAPGSEKESTVDHSPTTADQPATAESLKNRGNVLMKEGKFSDAIDMYSQALKLDSANSTYYANRAAAYMKMNDYSNALSDCKEAVRINPKYAKVYMRMGVIHQKLNDADKAKECYKKAVDLEPENAEYRSSLESLDQQPSAGRGGPLPPGFDPSSFGNLLNSPMFMNMASNIMSTPAFQNIASGILQSQMSGGNTPPPPPGAGAGGMNVADMIPQFTQMAQQMQETNPEVFESIRNQAAQFRPNHDDTLPPEGDK